VIPVLAEKRFQTSILVDAAGCPSDTFRAWRNRNGLFPETQGSNKWNRFSYVDIMITGIVADLSKRGLSAQLAVDAAMSSAPLLEKLCEPAPLRPDDDVFMVATDLLKVWKECGLPILVVDGSGQPSQVRLVGGDEPISSAFVAGSGSVVIVPLDKVLPFCMARLVVYHHEIDYSSGERRPKAGGLTPALFFPELEQKSAKSNPAKSKAGRR
jgi:hypothetical protein